MTNRKKSNGYKVMLEAYLDNPCITVNEKLASAQSGQVHKASDSVSRAKGHKKKLLNAWQSSWDRHAGRRKD